MSDYVIVAYGYARRNGASRRQAARFAEWAGSLQGWRYGEHVDAAHDRWASTRGTVNR